MPASEQYQMLVCATASCRSFATCRRMVRLFFHGIFSPRSLRMLNQPRPRHPQTLHPGIVVPTLLSKLKRFLPVLRLYLPIRRGIEQRQRHFLRHNWLLVLARATYRDQNHLARSRRRFGLVHPRLHDRDSRTTRTLPHSQCGFLEVALRIPIGTFPHLPLQTNRVGASSKELGIHHREMIPTCPLEIRPQRALNILEYRCHSSPHHFSSSENLGIWR
mmetsp:Transcript_10078/g.11557  ORF Transcript_10078/g.11557 Transcript_10078/m.11557 type:complete len:218 (-) Transcript_10078:701-1354(-)